MIKGLRQLRWLRSPRRCRLSCSRPHADTASASLLPPAIDRGKSRTDLPNVRGSGRATHGMKATELTRAYSVLMASVFCVADNPRIERQLPNSARPPPLMHMAAPNEYGDDLNMDTDKAAWITIERALARNGRLCTVLFLGIDTFKSDPASSVQLLAGRASPASRRTRNAHTAGRVVDAVLPPDYPEPEPR
jgi:hypothetical protein